MTLDRQASSLGRFLPSALASALYLAGCATEPAPTSTPEAATEVTPATKARGNIARLTQEENPRSFRGVDFSGKSVKTHLEQGYQLKDLTCIDFFDAKLNEADLSNVVAPNADFSFAVMTGATFDHSHFPGGRFWNADLEWADFSQVADLTGAEFYGANISNAVFPEGIEYKVKGLIRNADGSLSTLPTSAITQESIKKSSRSESC